jgi:hypothetical protein
MSHLISVSIEKNAQNEAILGSLGILDLRWDKRLGAYVGIATGKAWTALGQQSHLIPLDRVRSLKGGSDYARHSASRRTLRKFARAAAVADGNGFFGEACDRNSRHEDQYLREAEAAAMVLEGLGVEPDSFAKLFADPGSAFSKRASFDHPKAPGK